MQIKSNWYEKSECLALSCIVHVILLLLASLHQEKLSTNLPTSSTVPEISLVHPTIPSPRAEQSPAEPLIDPLSAPLINAPCILYKGGGAQKTTDTHSPSEQILKKVKASLEGNTEEDMIKNNEATTNEATTSDIAEKSSHSETAESIESPQQHSPVNSETSSTPVIATISSPSFLHSNEPISHDQTLTSTSSSDKEKMTGLKVETVFETSTQKKEETGDGTRKRKLRLSDLFKNLSSLPLVPSYLQDTQEDGDGSGAPAVIVQGDIRYHSFVGGIVDHINSTSKHRNGDAIVGKLIQSGTIKQNLKMSITLQKSGKVLDARILISSGCPQLDSFWIATAYDASPFAPLPSHFKRDMVRVELATQL